MTMPPHGFRGVSFLLLPFPAFFYQHSELNGANDNDQNIKHTLKPIKPTHFIGQKPGNVA